jgi:antitoxin ParD1/3/4
MVSLNIRLSEQLQAFIDEQVASGRYKDASDYIDRLIVEDRERLAQEKLETLLVEGLDSGKPIEATDLWWEQKRDRLIETARQEQQ